nr:hypothetical protein [Dyella acidiphila]
MPLGALHKPLAPHDHYSQRVLLSLHALGIIEPEISQSHAEDWLLARDWMRHGFDSVAWRIRWAPRDCRRQHEELNELLRDLELSEDTSLVLLALWEDLALAEVAQYARWSLAKAGYNPEWTERATDALHHALEDFSVSQVMYLIYLAMRTLAMTHQQGGLDATRLSHAFAEAISTYARRAQVESWAIRGMARPADLPMSTLALIFAHEVTRLDDEYLTKRPSLDALVGAMTRHRTLH